MAGKFLIDLTDVGSIAFELAKGIPGDANDKARLAKIRRWAERANRRTDVDGR
jgi:hypothetical protein